VAEIDSADGNLQKVDDIVNGKNTFF